MKLYYKELSGIDELRREKRKLLKKAKSLSEKTIKSGNISTSNLSSFLEDPRLLTYAVPIIKSLISIIKGKKLKNVAFTTGKQLLGGYLKWWAITHGIQFLLKVLSKKSTTDNKNKQPA